jgi:hypothetical protein
VELLPNHTSEICEGKYRKLHIPNLPQFWEKFYFRPGNLGNEECGDEAVEFYGSSYFVELRPSSSPMPASRANPNSTAQPRKPRGTAAAGR